MNYVLKRLRKKESEYMQSLTLYHGSDHVLQSPVFGQGKEDNDYGSGFYTTEDKKKADSWAALTGGQSAYTNEYTLDTSKLSIINLDQYGTLAWMAEILSHRGGRTEIEEIAADYIIEQYRIDTSKADVLIGYQADDSYLDIISAFLNNQLSIDEVQKLFVKGDFGEQVFVKSEKAFSQLQFQGAYEVSCDTYYKKTELYARKEVEKFLLQRNVAIQLQGYYVEGLTLRDVINQPFVFDKESGFYVPENSREERTNV